MVPLETKEARVVGDGIRPADIFAGTDGWYVRMSDGTSFGPFQALRDIEDWMDARDNQTPQADPSR
jgi:hypothetical protein